MLLVDDDAVFLEALARLVAGQPELEVTAAVSDGIAALDQVEADQPDAVVIDLHMPLLDGISTVARLRCERPTLCLIAVTGDHAPELRAAAREAGADEVLLKQELVDALAGRLRETLTARRAAN